MTGAWRESNPLPCGPEPQLRAVRRLLHGLFWYVPGAVACIKPVPDRLKGVLVYNDNVRYARLNVDQQSVSDQRDERVVVQGGRGVAPNPPPTSTRTDPAAPEGSQWPTQPNPGSPGPDGWPTTPRPAEEAVRRLR